MKKFVLCLLVIALFLPTPHPMFASISSEEIQFIGKGLVPEVLRSPSYLASDQNRLIVVDESLHQIALFSSNLERIGTFGSFGQSESEFDGLGRVRILPNLLFVLDRNNQRIQVFDFRLRFQRQFSLLQQEDPNAYPNDFVIMNQKVLVSMKNRSFLAMYSLEGQFERLVQLGIDELSENGSLYADSVSLYLWNEKASKGFQFNHDLTLIREFSFPEVDQAKIEDSSFDLFSFEQKLYFLDKLQGKVLVCDIEEPERLLESWESKLSNPSFMTISQGKVIISSLLQGTLSQFNLEGKVLKKVSRSQDLNDYWIRPEKIVRDSATSSMFVWDSGALMIKELSPDGTTKKIFPLDQVLPLGMDQWSFALIPEGFAMLSIEENCIYIIDRNVKVLRKIGPLLANNILLTHATDIASDDTFLYLTDSATGRIIKTDFQGSLAQNLIGSSSSGSLLYPVSIDVDEYHLMVMDTQQHAIFWYTKEGQFLGKAGKHGNEIGSFLHRAQVKWIAPGRALITDTDHHRVQLFDIWTRSFRSFGQYGSVEGINLPPSAKAQDRYTQLAGSLFYPSSAHINEAGVWIADTMNARLQLVPFERWGSDFIESIPPRVEVSFDMDQDMIQERFLLWSEAPLWASGELQSTNPGIEISPKQFQSLPLWVNVRFHRDLLKASSKKEDRIMVKVDGANASSIPVLFEWEEKPSYHIDAPVLFSVEAEQAFRIPFSITPLYDFDENISFTLRGTPSNSIPTIEPSFYRHGEPFNGNIILTLNPNRSWEHRRYEMVLEAKSMKSNQVKQAFITIFLNHSALTAPRRVLAELFSGIWCTQCIYYHYVFKKLDDEIGNQEANFIQYYVFSTVDQPKPRLACEKSNARIRFYQHDQGLPSLYFDGVDSFKGVPYEDREAAVENICRTRVENRKKDPALLSIIAHSSHDSVNNKGLLNVHLRVLGDLQNVKEPRLFAALVESNINYTASSGKSEHHLIFRDYLPLDLSKPEQMGIPLRDSAIGFTGKQGEEVHLAFPYEYPDFFLSENLHLVVFVQDQALKKVYQSYRLPLNFIRRDSIELRMKEDPLIKTLAGTKVVHKFSVKNPGLSPLKLFTKFDAEFSSEQLLTLELPPFSVATIPIEILIPDTYPSGSVLSYRMQVYSENSSIDQTIRGQYLILEDLDPGFEIELEQEEMQVLSGEETQVRVKVIPAPYFEDTVSLSLEGDLGLIETYEFETNQGSLPLETNLLLKIHKDRFKDRAQFTIRAKGGLLDKTIDFSLNIHKNPKYFPPMLVLFEPEEDLVTKNENILVRGKTDQGNTLTLNGSKVPLNGEGSFEIQHKLAEGLNELIFRAENEWGLFTEYRMQVTLDTIAPEIVWLNFPDSTHLSKFTLKGQTEADNLVFFIDEVVAVDENGYFEVVLDLMHGINYLEFLVIDPAKNETLYLMELRQIVLIKLAIGKAFIEINEEERPLPAAPYIKNSRTMVPLRALSEAFGFQVEWVAENQEIILTLDQKKIHFYIGKTKVLFNQETLTIDAAPEIVKSSTFVPLRVVSEIMGARIEWFASEQLIRIEY